MATETKRRGRPPKDPGDRRDRVIAVRFTADEWSRLQFEINYAKQSGVRLAPSRLVRKAVLFYGRNGLGQASLERDYPRPKARRKVR